MFLVVCVFVLELNQVAGGVGGSQEDEFHDCVVIRGSIPKDVKISRGEDKGVENLTFQGYT